MNDEEAEAFASMRFRFEGPLQAMDLSRRKFYAHVKKKPAVCHHWLRSRMCMKGDTCEFLHGYYPRLIPRCQRFPNCNEWECPFRHEAAEPCHAYERGYCKYGPKCLRQHTKKKGPPCDCTSKTCSRAHPRRDQTFWREAFKWFETKYACRILPQQDRRGPLTRDPSRGTSFPPRHPRVPLGPSRPPRPWQQCPRVCAPRNQGHPRARRPRCPW